MAADAHRLGAILECAAAAIAQEILAPAVVRILEALRHDLRRLELPEIDVVGPVAGDEEIEEAVAVVIEPRRAVGVDPCGKSRTLADGDERTTVHVAEKLRP